MSKQRQPKNKIIPYEIPRKRFPFVVDYHSKFPIVMSRSTSVEHLVRYSKSLVLFQKIRRILQEAEYITGQFIIIHHLSNGQVEVCIKFIDRTMKKCFETNANICLDLLQVTSMQIVSGPPRPMTILFNIPMQSLIPRVNRSPILYHHNEDYYNAFKLG